jgi:predicted lactoylglutathione lyase
MLQSHEQVVLSTVWIGIHDDSIFDLIQSSGVKVVQPPSSRPGAYEMRIADPDGNILWLGAEPRVE